MQEEWAEYYAHTRSTMFSWNNGSAPGHLRDAVGRLLLGGIRADVLASAYGTPLVVMDIAMIQRAIDMFQSSCDPLGLRISYAAKAFLCAEFARLLSGSGLAMDVCSLGELRVAESGGFRPERLTLHGAGKTDGELEAAVAGRAGRIVLDGLSDLRRLAELAKGGRAVSIILRLNTGVSIDTHSHVRTVGGDAKFGLVPGEEPDAIAAIQNEPALKFAGLHAHAGSQIFDCASLAANVAQLRAAADRFAAHGLICRTLIAGGGFGVQSDPRRPQDALDIGAAIAACTDNAVGSESAPALPIIEFEPGRAIVAHAGTTLYEILAVKWRPSRNVVIVDGGMADNPRPAMYGAYHHVVPAVETSEALRATRVFGRACEQDFIADSMLPRNLERGDLLAVCTTGAYTHSMSSRYNRFPSPTVVAVHEGTHAMWIPASD